MTSPYISDQSARTETAAALGRLLPDCYIIYLKTQGFHWNVVGPQFEPLHTLFQAQYTELAQAIDEIAERIRTLGAKAPASFSEFKELTSISEETGAPAADAMIGQLVSDHTTASRAALQIVRRQSRRAMSRARISRRSESHYMRRQRG
jgi:starvation-inducible DNA-binding protein